MDKTQSVTIFDVAQASGVSYSTVSRVLNGFEYVKENTRKRVLEAAETLGYVANLQARSLAGGKSKMIGVLVPTIDNGYISSIAQGIDEEVANLGYDLLLYTTHRKQGKESQFVNALANGLSDGLLLMVPLITADVVERNYLEVLREKRFPYVLIDQTDSTGQSAVVDSDNWQGAYDATQYLISLGHQRIGFVTGLMAINAARERLSGYQASLQDHKLTIDPQLIVEGDFYHQQAYLAAKRLLTLQAPPSAIFASNDLSAFGVMDAARDQGLSIPGDISVIGFDDIPQAAISYPKLTTVKQPLAHMGRVAVKMLFDQIDKAAQPSHITLPASLVIRDSCAVYHA